MQIDFQEQISFDRESIRKYSLELSPNGKAKCAHCGKNIPKGEPRIRVCFRPPDDWLYHRCLPCLTEQILANIAAEWSEYSDPLKAFVAAQPPEVLSYLQSTNPLGGQGIEADLQYVIQKLHQYAEEELAVVGEKRQLTTLRDGDTITVPVGKRSKKKLSLEG